MVPQLWYKCIYRNLIPQIQKTGQIFIDVYSITNSMVTIILQIPKEISQICPNFEYVGAIHGCE